MPVIDCAKCGYKTNTACSNHFFPIREDGKANECYARWENDKWSKGCSFDNAEELTKKIVQSLFEDDIPMYAIKTLDTGETVKERIVKTDEESD